MSRAVMQQALDVFSKEAPFIPRGSEVIKALRAELAKPDLMPIAFGAHRYGRWGYIWTSEDDVAGWIKLSNCAQTDINAYWHGPVALYDAPNRPRGRPPAPPRPQTVGWRPDTQAQREKWFELGGAKWVKRLINAAIKAANK